MGHPIVTKGDFVAQLCKSVRTYRAVIWGGKGVGAQALVYLMGSTCPKKRRFGGIFSSIGLNGVFECIFITAMHSTCT